jgi:hypothetical protein
MATERTAMTPDGSVVHLDSDNTYMYDYGATVNGDIAGGANFPGPIVGEGGLAGQGGLAGRGGQAG